MHVYLQNGGAAFFVLTFLFARTSAVEPTKVPATTFTHVVPIDANDDAAAIVAKAARLVPHRAQRLYHLDEFSAFIHFGPNTFTGLEWGSGKERPEIFDPGDTFNTDQWCESLQAAGMRKVIITAKHHDGFCLWQTRYNRVFSVRAIPWRRGQGDVLRALADSCHKYHLKLGVYLSPADLFHIENETHGLYGNQSASRASIIPTAPESLQSEPTAERTDRPPGTPTFHVTVDDYNRYFMNQLYELLTEYGPIHEVWFDGAHPKRKGGQTYAKQEWFAMIRSLAPEAAIFGGPDIRWCGNEGGHTRATEWSILPTQDESVSGEDRPDEAPGDIGALTAKHYTVYGKPYESRELRYLIAEVNTSIREGWFWRNDDEQAVRGPDDVFDIYERAVGGNAGFLLNVPPDKQGRIAARDVACLAEVGRRIRATYATDLLQNASLPAAPQAIDGQLETFWQAADEQGELEIVLPESRRINRFVLQEAVFDVGQRIERHALDALIDDRWKEIAQGTTIGFKRIARFPAVTTDRFRIRIIASRLQPTIAEMSAHYFEQPPLPVVVARDADERVILSTTLLAEDFRWNRRDEPGGNLANDPSSQIHYTLDDSEPTAASTIYAGPMALPHGGRLQARSIHHGALGPVTRKWLGLSKRLWRVHTVSSQADTQHAALLAFDNNRDTFWLSNESSARASDPHELVIDLGEEVAIGGLTYLPPQGARGNGGSIDNGRIEVSRDAQAWSDAGRFQFGNLVNDPSERTYRFATSHRARYIRIAVESTAQQGTRAAAAEFGFLPAVD